MVGSAVVEIVKMKKEMMRKIAFGYSTRCNIRCEHCVAADDARKNEKMKLCRAKEIIAELAAAGVRGISFTAGEPLLYLDDIAELVSLCREYEIYTRVVTNSFWAKSADLADSYTLLLKESGLSQLRLSYSRWHQKNVPRHHIVNAAESCQKAGLDYFVSFVTDFSEDDDGYEQYLREQKLLFFPEPVIFSGRAQSFERSALRTDYQENCCSMNPYLAPSLDMYACCDAGSHFTRTNFFHLGNLKDNTIEEMFRKSEGNSLYNHIRSTGITAIASFAGFRAREIVGYRKCELCEKMFNSPELLGALEKEAESGLKSWHR
ncbi:radical SAM superfamily enzyme [Desulfocapsa sulfexigens DSM 10523]|uniref:Radical SAM superfamily enzyme n=2 Tax=Desulfocapsa TaxID=53318 RepID=M1P8R4_DESSD|nr:radical SAM superfamily enzyme [Desulfocapsa sulfexigens DSM 10523]